MATMGMTIELSPESIEAMNNLARALDQNGIVTDQRLLSILRDIWFQFSLERGESISSAPRRRWSGGLSVLEDVFRELRVARMIDDDGLERD